jgi:tetratricopeptide (TPR) repeat protein
VYEAVFRDLRRLADWFSAGLRPSSGSEIERLVQRLGATAVPLLCRELCGADPRRRDAARDALAAVAAHGATARARVTAELHPITGGCAPDDAKVVALGLLSELGEHADVRFADPAAIRIRSAIALASHLETAADVASAADLMVHQLEAADITQMLEVMVNAAPDAAHRLAAELALRLDLAADLRDRIAQIAAAIATGAAGRAPAPTGSPPAPAFADPGDPGDWRDHTRAAVLVDAAARRVVIASRPIEGQRRWRRWAVLIGASGRIEDCLHEDDAGPYGDTTALRAELCADGYRVSSLETEHAHEVVAAAARLTAESTRALPPAYYLGRDLLGLADAHLGGRGRGAPGSAALALAIELIGAGEPARAAAVLERCDPDHPEVAAEIAAALAAALLAQHQPAAALAPLRRAVRAEPDWPLHHWNLAVAFHQLGDDRGCYHALRQFVATSAIPSGLAGDPEQPARLARAERRIAELERAAWLVGRSLRRPGARRPRDPAARPAKGAARNHARHPVPPSPTRKKKRTSAST